ncbi:hypothetical protein ACFQ88_23675 [Paenibacillus sp. NPDC056579]|uniref:hypothetical protein n=1 Tax=Paenibacillus sp. NPDC056579 TaxID=3345871 RepID=UPI0036BE161A
MQRVRCENGEMIEVHYVILTISPQIASRLVPSVELTSLQTWEQQAIPITAACLVTVASLRVIAVMVKQNMVNMIKKDRQSADSIAGNPPLMGDSGHNVGLK